MSTHARIGRVLPSGRVESIYCHSDGYLEGVGNTLRLHYQNEMKVRALIALGSISFLKAEVAPLPGVEHSYGGKRAEGVTLAYHRDRGEIWAHTKKRWNRSLDSFLLHPEPYSYLWDRGKWCVWSHHVGSLIQGGELTSELVAEALTA